MEKKVVNLNIDDILPNRFQPRLKFDEEAMEELAGSIKTYGVIQPIIVRPIGDKYEIIAGERRYKASVLAGLENIPAIINQYNNKESAEIALVENIQRKDLTPIEEAVSYKKILDMGYMSQDELAEKIDKTQSTISNKLRLLSLEDNVQDALLNNQISERHARSLLRLEDKEEQLTMLNRIINERLTVRQTDEVIDKLFQTGDKKINIKEKEMNETKESSIFDIPTDPIVDDAEIFDEIDSSLNFFNDDNETPGFLDVAGIEKSAEDINVSKPLADMDSLLKSDPSYVVPEEKEETSVEEIQEGKFFTFPIEEQTEEQQKEETTPSVISSEDLDHFENFNFGFDSKTEEPKEDEVKEESIFAEIQPNYDFVAEDLPETKETSLDNEVLEEVDFSSVLSVVRKAVSKVKTLGYEVDTDELDFANSYQIIINIEKK